MNPNPNSEERLLRLLRFKRHEQPPPGFFDRFPNRVLTRLQAGPVAVEQTWWQRIVADVAMEGQGFVTWAYSLTACSALFLGVCFFQVWQGEHPGLLASAQPWLAAAQIPLADVPKEMDIQQIGVPFDIKLPTSMNPEGLATGSGRFSTAQVVPARFSLVGD